MRIELEPSNDSNRTLAGRVRHPVSGYLIAIAAIALVTGLNHFAYAIAGYWAPSLLYLATVTLLSLVVDGRAVLLSAALSALCWNVLFIPPRFTLFIADLPDMLMLAMFFIVSAVTGSLTAQLRRKQLDLQRREKTLQQLYDLSGDLTRAGSLEAIQECAIHHVGQISGGPAALLLNVGGVLDFAPAIARGFPDDQREIATARRAFRNPRASGRFTATVPGMWGRYVPLQTAAGVVGVLALRLDARPDPEREALLQTMTNQIAVAIERETFALQSREAKLAEESERLFSVVLNSISHELRSPLTAILGAAGTLLDRSIAVTESSRVELLGEIDASSRRLRRIVDNLLDMSRLESGRMELRREKCDIREIAADIPEMFGAEFRDYEIEWRFAPDLPPIYADSTLLTQIFYGLLQNITQHCPPKTRVVIGAATVVENERTYIEVSIADNGPGPRAADLERIFEKFYRGPQADPGGSGLGLSLARGVVELHGGRIEAAGNADGGLTIRMRLPAVDSREATL